MDLPAKIELDSDLTLDERAEKIRWALDTAYKCAVFAGYQLIEARKEIPHGQWERWCLDKAGIHPRSAHRYIKATQWIVDSTDFRINDLSLFDGNKGALESLADAPTDTQTEAIKMMKDGVYITNRVVEGIIGAVGDIEHTFAMVDDTDESMTRLVLEHDVDPEIIPALTRIRSYDSEVFNGIVASGVIDGPEGDQIPLSEVNIRDINDFVNQYRYERKKEEVLTKFADRSGRIGVRAKLTDKGVFLSAVVCGDTAHDVVYESASICAIGDGEVLIISNGILDGDW